MIAAGTASLSAAWIGRAAEAGNPLASFDREVENFMRARNLPGGALAIVRRRKLIYARGYGWADREREIPAQARSLFRLASVSKPVTAIGILKLAEQRRLNLDEPAFERLRLVPLPGQKPDVRLAKITIRHLLQHTGGWNRNRSGDPMFMAEKIAHACRVVSPPDARSIIRYMLGQPLDFDPGTQHSYSNFGYCVLGRLIEELTGMSYEAWIKQAVLAPAGVTEMRIGHSLESQAAAGEVKYYKEKERRKPSVFAKQPGLVPAPYGSFHL